jgi:hypothetical protein
LQRRTERFLTAEFRIIPVVNLGRRSEFLLTAEFRIKNLQRKPARFSW